MCALCLLPFVSMVYLLGVLWLFLHLDIIEHCMRTSTFQSAVLREFDFLNSEERELPPRVGPLILPPAPPVPDIAPEQLVPPSPQPVVEFPEDEVHMFIICTRNSVNLNESILILLCCQSLFFHFVFFYSLTAIFNSSSKILIYQPPTYQHKKKLLLPQCIPTLNTLLVLDNLTSNT